MKPPILGSEGPDSLNVWRDSLRAFVEHKCSESRMSSGPVVNREIPRHTDLSAQTSLGYATNGFNSFVPGFGSNIKHATEINGVLQQQFSHTKLHICLLEIFLSVIDLTSILLL